MLRAIYIHYKTVKIVFLPSSIFCADLLLLDTQVSSTIGLSGMSVGSSFPEKLTPSPHIFM